MKNYRQKGNETASPPTGGSRNRAPNNVLKTEIRVQKILKKNDSARNEARATWQPHPHSKKKQYDRRNKK
ncbi:hypothetical protein LH29_12455 [Draconibacterium sediminis]|uniref:Uncharacterized protein n=1 Tax=Draconibacterium sediminis TaxID=1544798 RepID=A0A0D8JDH9_9BACT|nr:hypothetical protein LH29_12455 [Draconibacterium sediminis]